MSLTVTASNGVSLPVDSLEIVLTYVTDTTNVETMTCSYQGIDYVLTFTYDGDSNVTNISQWVAQ